ncbi:phosphotransferase enzyme family protein [Flavihumibacter sp. ZG627]|uniref:phosphotransferase enzyme family protein n=1 Tax=Flavihumibacter sp. ZG627 TaxID=1463156 RepID=UPI00057DBAC2|nr:aminoglycoside phosphotransferase family protein [Flavihumibacter sp. ZG627]KIC91385.1 aminoglycoside phosphotransferase [Flavihumibacter sp. ZG627]
MARSILPAYLEYTEDLQSEPYGSGLINTTWRVYNKDSAYILQKINAGVFKDPVKIASNVRMISDYLRHHYPEYLFVDPIKTLENKDLAFMEGDGFYRLTPFIKGSHTEDVVLTAEVAYEAAKQFGRFSALLDGFDANKLFITIPDFHNLRLRYDQFKTSIKEGNQKRILRAGDQIDFIAANETIVDQFDAILQNPDFRIRVMHHDTKISNVLLDEKNKGICVIDLDTLMPGYFISDVGDMLRTYLSPASEEETDFSKIYIREEIFEAIVKGYLGEMRSVLSDAEKTSIVYAGKFMIYMQAIRFLTDYFNDDTYYGARYPEHNFNRAANQIDLLRKLMEKESILVTLLQKFI